MSSASAGVPRSATKIGDKNMLLVIDLVYVLIILAFKRSFSEGTILEVEVEVEGSS